MACKSFTFRTFLKDLISAVLIHHDLVGVKYFHSFVVLKDQRTKRVLDPEYFSLMLNEEYKHQLWNPNIGIHTQVASCSPSVCLLKIAFRSLSPSIFHSLTFWTSYCPQINDQTLAISCFRAGKTAFKTGTNRNLKLSAYKRHTAHALLVTSPPS